MANETDFLNDALGQIGATYITAIDDESTNANHCQVFWPPLRRSLIRAHHWNFATARALLAQDVVAPISGFAFSYALPNDYLKVVEYSGVLNTVTDIVIPSFPITSRYVIEGKKLLTNDTQAYIEYLKDVDNPDLWDPMFYQAASHWLASKLASAITKNEKTAQLKMQEATLLYGLATSVDGQEGTEVPQVIDNLLRVR